MSADQTEDERDTTAADADNADEADNADNEGKKEAAPTKITTRFKMEYIAKHWDPSVYKRRHPSEQDA